MLNLRTDSCSSFNVILGWVDTMVSKLHAVNARHRDGSSATTSAVLGCLSRIDISPKYWPGPSFARTCPSDRTSTVPSAITKKPTPVSPLRTITSPPLYFSSLNERAITFSSFSLRLAHRGAFCNISTIELVSETLSFIAAHPKLGG